MLKLRPPTWRFQKFHPNRCSHQNGVYRKIKSDDAGSYKEFFICADCVDVIEEDKLEKK